MKISANYLYRFLLLEYKQRNKHQLTLCLIGHILRVHKLIDEGGLPHPRPPHHLHFRRGPPPLAPRRVRRSTRGGATCRRRRNAVVAARPLADEIAPTHDPAFRIDAEASAEVIFVVLVVPWLMDWGAARAEVAAVVHHFGPEGRVV